MLTAAIVNLGFIGNLKLPGPSTTGILISGGSVNQGIINVGTIAGTVAAIDVSGATGPTAIKQGAGTISGAIKLSANADTLTINGGSVVGDIVGAGTTDTAERRPGQQRQQHFHLRQYDLRDRPRSTSRRTPIWRSRHKAC